MRRKRRFSKEVEEALRKQSPPPGRGRARVGVVERGNASPKIWATPTQNPDAPKKYLTPASPGFPLSREWRGRVRGRFFNKLLLFDQPQSDID
ncbi:MAG: hypothetical protein AABY65_00885 [Nitrospirota bacterium]